MNGDDRKWADGFSADISTRRTGSQGTGTHPINERPAKVFLSEGSRIEGKLHLDGDSSIEGRVEGEICCEGGELRIGSKAVITGNLSAPAITVAGTVTGDIFCTGLLRLQAGAQVKGRLDTARLAVEEGVRFEGGCCMKDAAADQGPEVDLNDRLL